MTVSALNKAALEAEHAARIYFIHLDFTGTPFYACTGALDYVVLGQTWYGIGDIQGISDITDTADVAARPITMSLTGVDSYITTPVQSRTNYKGRSAKVYRGLLDSNFDLIDDPDIIWTGRMDVGSMLRGGEYLAQMVCEPLAARMLRPNLSRYSDEDHQLRSSGDKFFEFLSQMEQKDVVWGGSRVGTSSGIGPGPPRRLF